MILVAIMLKMKAEAPMPVMMAPVTIPFFCGNQRPPVTNGIW